MSGRHDQPGEQPRFDQSGLDLWLSAAASPDRVALAASFIADALRAADAHLSDGAVTMVVDNYALKARVRPQTQEGQRAVDILQAVLRDPSAAVTSTNDQAAADVAAVIAQDGPKLTEFAPVFRAGPGQRKRHLRTMDSVFIASVKAVVQTFHAYPIVRGTAVIYSKVLRVGRTSDSKAVKVRLTINGRPQDLAVRDESRLAFFDAAKEDRVVLVRIDAAWRMMHDRPSIDVARSFAASVDSTWAAATGADIIRDMRVAAGGAFDDLNEIEARLGSDGEDLH